MGKRVFTSPIQISDGTRDVANLLFAQEHAKIFGNKQVTLSLLATPQTSNAGPMQFTIQSQKDETGSDVNLFSYDIATNLLKPTTNIDNIKQLEFHHLITYQGSNTAGGNNGANDVVMVLQRIVDTDGGSETLEEIDRINSAIDLGDGEFIQKRIKTEPFPPENPVNEMGINSLIGLGWNIQEYNNSAITVDTLQVTIDINYYDPTAQGGN